MGNENSKKKKAQPPHGAGKPCGEVWYCPLDLLKQIAAGEVKLDAAVQKIASDHHTLITYGDGEKPPEALVKAIAEDSSLEATQLIRDLAGLGEGSKKELPRVVVVFTALGHKDCKVLYTWDSTLLPDTGDAVNQV